MSPGRSIKPGPARQPEGRHGAGAPDSGGPVQKGYICVDGEAGGPPVTGFMIFVRRRGRDDRGSGCETLVRAGESFIIPNGLRYR